MKNKAQAMSLSQMLTGLLTIALIGFLVFFFITRGQEIQVKVEENEILRRRLILTNVLLSSDKLVYSDDFIHRGLFDKEKLDNIKSNPESLYSEISYQGITYYVKVTDIENGNEWLVGKNFKSIFESPVAIRYSDGDVHIGLISVDFKEGIVPPRGTTTTTIWLNGKRFRFVGVNSNIFIQKDVTNQDYDNALTYLKNSCGVSVLRVFASPFGNAGLEPVKRLLGYAKKHDMKVIITLHDCFGTTSGFCKNTWKWDFSPGSNGYNFITELKDEYKDEILAWEIANEPHCYYDGGADVRSCNNELKTFLIRASQELKRLDPDHLVTVGLEGKPDTVGIQIYPELISIENIDIGQVHCYTGCGYTFRDLEYSKEANKPFFIGEYNTDFSKTKEERAQKIKEYIEKIFIEKEGKTTDADGFLIWQFGISGYSEYGCEISQYGFCQGDPICGILKEMSDKIS